MVINMKEIVIATKNAHKIIEMKKMLEPLGYKVLTLFDFLELPDIIEDKDTFRGNALTKAITLSNYLNKDVVADDSGLEVFALNNEPGVYSARYAGEDVSYQDNNKLLLKNMEGIEKRGARFVTTMCFYRLQEEPVYFEDYLYGKIALDFKGTNGFGYDPLFIPKGDTRHLAEYALEEKNIIANIEEVVVYGKIPRNSIAIPTITGGTYSPDFMYVVKRTNGQKDLNIIVETKDVDSISALRGTEKAKIECAEIFFNQLSIEGYNVYFRKQINNKKMKQIITELI